MDKNKSIELDAKYILKLSALLPLPKFEKTNTGSYKFRCVFCCNSRNHANKRSGYFYLKGHTYNYCCFMCNHRSSLKTVLRELKPDLYMKYLEERQSKRESFRDAENNMKWMDMIYKYDYEGLTSFDDMKKHSGKRFREITKRLREEDKKRKEKKEQRKETDARDDG